MFPLRRQNVRLLRPSSVSGARRRAARETQRLSLPCRLRVAWLLLLASSWAGACVIPPPAASANGAAPAGAEEAQVVRVIDGATIVVARQGREFTVRYLWTDAPAKGEPLYNEATKLNQLLIGNQPVFLLQAGDDRDPDGRLLRYVYTADGLWVNAELLRQGMARLSALPPDAHWRATLAAAEQAARDQALGLWR